MFLEQTCDIELFWSVPNCYAVATQDACLIQKTLPHGLELALEKCRPLPNSCLRISENRR